MKKINMKKCTLEAVHHYPNQILDMDLIIYENLKLILIPDSHPTLHWRILIAAVHLKVPYLVRYLEGEGLGDASLHVWYL